MADSEKKYISQYRHTDGSVYELKDKEAREEIANAVKKVEGKGLSSNDYTDEEKNKLNALTLLGLSFDVITNTFTICGKSFVLSDCVSGGGESGGGNEPGGSDGERELSSFTMSAISLSGNDNLTNEQKIALDDFFIAIGATTNSGVFSKIRKLYLPFLCTNVSNALVNYVDGKKDYTPSDSYWKLNNGGLYPIQESPFTSDKLLLESVWIDNIYDYGMFFYVSENTSIGSGKNFMPFMNASGSSITRAITITSQSTRPLIIHGKIGTYTDTPICDYEKKQIGLYAFSITPGNVTYITPNDSSIKSKSISVGTVDSTTSAPLYAFAAAANGTSQGSSYCDPLGVMALGTSMTNDEMSLIKSSLNELMSKF